MSKIVYLPTIKTLKFLFIFATTKATRGYFTAKPRESALSTLRSIDTF